MLIYIYTLLGVSQQLCKKQPFNEKNIWAAFWIMMKQCWWTLFSIFEAFTCFDIFKYVFINLKISFL